MKALIRRVLFYLFLIVTVIVVSGSVSVYLYKDRLIQRFIEEMNQSINTPVHVDNLDISLWKYFPYISVDLNNVKIEESYEWSDAPLLTAKKIALSFHPIEIINGNYTVKQLHISEAMLAIKIDRKGINNFSIFKSNTASGNTTFDISKVTFQNVEMTYEDLQADKILHFSTRQLAASLDVINNVYYITAKGDAKSHHIIFSGNTFLKDVSLNANTKVKYNSQSKQVSIAPSAIEVYNSDFRLSGSYELSNSDIDISLSNDQTNLQTIIALIPDRYTTGLNKYNSKGEGFFELKLKGNFNNNNFPSINIDFGLSNASIFHPDFSTELDSVSLTGNYQSPNFMKLTNTSLSLSNVTGRLGSHPFSSSIAIKNFNNPFIDLNFKGNLEINMLLNFYPNNEIDSASGIIASDITLKGSINDLEKKSTVKNVKTSGELDLQDVSFLHKASNIPFDNLNGILIFNNNDLALTNFSGKIGSSDFLLNGIFKNFAAFVLLDNQPLGIEADLSSTLIDLDELLSGNFTSTQSETEAYSFSISSNLQLKFNCDIEQLKFRRFLGNNLRGDLLVKNQVAATNNISVKTMDGNLSLTGSADASTDSVFVYSEVELNKIALDQLFFVFENFKQDFLVDSHLKGSANATISAFLAFDKHLNFNAKELVSDVSATITNGELNNFEPMQNLSDYLDGEELSALRFSELQNDIHIENETIYIPKMEINSNATNITIGGTHTFDQHINYNVVAPLNNRKKIDSDEVFGAIDEDDSGKMKVFLKITGTTDDYKVSYDKRALKKNVISNFKKEVKELKDAFRNKGKEERKEVVLEDDDYFDW